MTRRDTRALICINATAGLRRYLADRTQPRPA
jgi:hypothetical protein